MESSFVSSLGPFGLLLPGLFCAWLLVRSLGELAFRGARWSERLLGGAVLALSLLTAGMQILLYAGLVQRAVVVPLLVGSSALAYWLERRARPLRDAAEPRARLGLDLDLGLGLGLGVVGLGLGLVCLSAYFQPIWPWDSLGYHLAFVNFVLQGGGFAELPPDVPYLSTYPRNVALLFAGLRLLLPDDRLVDLGQIPLGLIGAAASAAIARSFGAARGAALLAGLSWLLLPAVFLQLPTNYIDIGGAAYFLLASYFLLLGPSPFRLACAGLAIGLFLGTKPSVPPAALLLAIVLAVRALGHGLGKAGVLGIGLSGALGLESYVQQIVRHGNPVWPAIVHVGPFELPGTITIKELLSSGAGAQKVHGPLFMRVVKSWTDLDAMPLFDMRVGGLGILFLLALPFAGWFALRQLRSARGAGRQAFWIWGALVAISVVTPDPAVVRYVFALPALLLAMSAAGLSALGPRTQKLVHLGLPVVLSWNLIYAAPGLTGEGPPLYDYPQLSWDERAWAVGANGPPRQFVEALRRLKPGEFAVYDKALWLPYLMWRSDLSNRAIRIPDGLDVASTRALLERPGVRLIAAGNDQPAAKVIAQDPSAYSHLFDCPEPCKVYLRR